MLYRQKCAHSKISGDRTTDTLTQCVQLNIKSGFDFVYCPISKEFLWLVINFTLYRCSQVYKARDVISFDIKAECEGEHKRLSSLVFYCN